MKRFYITLIALYFFAIISVASGRITVRFQPNKSNNVPETIITDTPAGTLTTMYRLSYGYKPYFGTEIYPDSIDGKATEVVEDADGFVYIKSPVSSFATESWLKGVKEADGKVVFELPQLVYDGPDSKGNPVKYYAQNIYGNTSEGFDYGVVEDDNRIVFRVSGDTLTKIGHTILGLTDENGTWTGYGDDSIRIFKEAQKPQAPAVLDNVKDYAMTFSRSETETGSQVVKIVRDGDTLYVGGLTSDQNLWAKGKIEGNNVIFKRQYLGEDDKGNMKYFIPVHADFVFNEYWGMWDITYTELENVVYSYNSESGEMKTDSSFLVNTGQYFLGTMDAGLYYTSELKPWTDNSYIPQTPTFTRFVGFNGQTLNVRFNLPVTAATGEELDHSKLFYRMYLDDNLFTFTPEVYKNLSENMTDVPCDFADNLDFWSYETTHTVYFYTNDFSRIGVQAVYKGGGKETVSDIVYRSNPTSGIRNSAVSSEIKNIEYVDISGRKVLKPQKGLYVKTTTFSDGSSISEKVVIK